MSILIKGMDMPTSCWRCPFCLTIDPDTYRCIPTGHEFESTFDAIDHIVGPCPLVEVQPHGRLIDADALDKQIYNDIPLKVFCNIARMAEMRNIVENAPTIIPAEEGE